MSSSMVQLLPIVCCILIIQLPTLAAHELRSHPEDVYVSITTADAIDRDLRALGEKLKPVHLIPLALIALGAFEGDLKFRECIPPRPDPYNMRPIELDRHDTRTYILHAATKRKISMVVAIDVFADEVSYMSQMPECHDAHSRAILLTDEEIFLVIETLVAKVKEAYSKKLDSSNEKYVLKPLPEKFEMLIPRQLDGGPKASSQTPADMKHLIIRGQLDGGSKASRENHVRIAPFTHKLEEYEPRENSPIQIFYHWKRRESDFSS